MGQAKCQRAFGAGIDCNPVIGFGCCFGQPRLDLIHATAIFPQHRLGAKHIPGGSPAFDQTAAETQYKVGIFDIEPDQGPGALGQV